MKIQISKKSGVSGSALLITLCTAIIIGLTLASYLVLVQTQSMHVERSQTWNSTMVVTEAGVEDALELVNKFAGMPTLDNWATSYSADGWARNGNIYSVTRFLDAASNTYYTVYITNVFDGTKWLPHIYSSGYISRSFALNSYNNSFAAAGIGGASILKRSVYVKTSRTPLFNFALAAKTQVDMHGFNIQTDSFDSSSTNYSNGGLYDPSKDKDGGDVLTDGTVTNTIISAGNAKIMGHAKTGPTGTITVGSQGSIGDKAWVTGGNTGPKQGWTSTDMNVAFDDVPSPNAIYNNPTWNSFPVSGAYIPLVGTSVGSIVPDSIASQTYYIRQLSQLSGTVYIGTNAHVVLWLPSGASFSGSQGITIAPGGSLTVYVGATASDAGVPKPSDAQFTATGLATLNNMNQKAENFSVMGLPNCGTIKIDGNAAFTGTIYAPEASVSMNGGGSTKKDPDGTDYYDFVGSALGKSITLNGHFHFHYDEALKDTGMGKQYTPSSWKEAAL